MIDKKEIPRAAKDIVDRELVIGPDDTEAVTKFFDHFDLKMPKVLTETLEAFKKDPNLKTQKKFVVEVNKAITEGFDIVALDEMFEPIVACANEVKYDLQFSDEMTELLKEDSTPQSESPEPSEPLESSEPEPSTS